MTKFEQALTKMNEEMKAPHTPELDRIHNWLCEQLDMDESLMETELAEGILDEAHSISGSMDFCYRKAQAAAAKGANYAMVADNTVFGWVKEYFLTKESKEDKKDNVAKLTAKSGISAASASDKIVDFKPNVQSTAESMSEVSAPVPTPSKKKAAPVHMEEISLFDF